jgi:hypothetical protein
MKMNEAKKPDWKMLDAFQKGIDDGFFQGNYNDTLVWEREELRASYNRGYDHGVWMYCEKEGA